MCVNYTTIKRLHKSDIKFFFLLAFCLNHKSQLQEDIKGLHFLGSEEDNKNFGYTGRRF